MSEGYGLVAKLLHWGMVLALGAQFAVGYAMERADDLLDWPVDLWRGGEDDRLLIVHVVLGAGILVMAVVRVAWRKAAGLPPWAETLSHGERRFVHRVEQILHVRVRAIVSMADARIDPGPTAAEGTARVRAPSQW